MHTREYAPECYYHHTAGVDEVLINDNSELIAKCLQKLGDLPV